MTARRALRRALLRLAWAQGRTLTGTVRWNGGDHHKRRTLALPQVFLQKHLRERCGVRGDPPGAGRRELYSRDLNTQAQRQDQVRSDRLCMWPEFSPSFCRTIQPTGCRVYSMRITTGCTGSLGVWLQVRTTP